MSGRLWRLPTSKSLKSCAGVTFTAPVPFSGIGVLVGDDGDQAVARAAARTCLPIRSLQRASSGCTATAVSPSIVSGRLVATVMNRPACPSIGYFRYQRCPSSRCSRLRRSETAVCRRGVPVHEPLVFVDEAPLAIEVRQRPSAPRVISPSSIVKRSRDQSAEAPSRRNCCPMAPPDSAFQRQTSSRNFSRPIATRLCWRSANCRSTTSCVAMPA